jgi:uncharacterized protein YprB with RNaseH-like and TPR domain
MSETPRSAAARALELLKTMEVRGVRTAADLERGGDARRGRPRHLEADATPGSDARVDPRLWNFYPAAEAIAGSEGGRCLRVRTEATLDGRRTRGGHLCPVHEHAPELALETIARITGEAAWRGVDPGKILFLDIESTGLATGAGTYAFLVGLGRFEAGGFCVEQYFMEDFADEAALIESLEREFSTAQAVVTYNGGTFDLPILASRFRMQRRTPRFPELHLDLLRYTRRVWRPRVGSASLGNIERSVLGITRLSDVPGMLIPSIYFNYMRGIAPERIVPVFDHHAQDIFSMGVLICALARAWEAPHEPRHADARDQWGLARLYASRGETERALACMEAATRDARDEQFAHEIAMRLARLYRRAGRLEDALAIWEARAPQAAPGRIDALIELAKHAEHRMKDYAAAQAWTRRAIALEGMKDAATAQALRHRLARLSARGERVERKEQREQPSAAAQDV